MDWREVVQRCFVDMNELEQAAVEKWLAHNSLDTLLEREMPESGDTVVPTQLVPRGCCRGRRVHRHKHAAQQPHHLALRVPRRCCDPSPALTGIAVPAPLAINQPQQDPTTYTTLCSAAPATSTQL